MTDEQLGAMWREECAKADHITWAATSFARRVEAAERERCASLCRGAIHAAAESGNAEAVRLISELHQRVLRLNGPVEPDPTARKNYE